MTKQLLSHTLFTACLLGLGCVAFGAHAEQATPVVVSYAAPADKTPVDFAKSRPGQINALSVKDKMAQAQQAEKVEITKPAEPVKKQVVQTETTKKTQAKSIEILKKKVEKNKKETQTTQVQSKLAKEVIYGESVHDWAAESGESVRDLLMKWSEKSGWTMVWKLDRDYILEAGVVFRGNYMDVAGALLRSFARATPAPIGTFYKGNRVLVVSTREDENNA